MFAFHSVVQAPPVLYDFKATLEVFSKQIMFPFCDRHNNGHVTKIQASQCLHMLGLTDVPEEIKVTKSPSLFSALTADYLKV